MRFYEVRTLDGRLYVVAEARADLDWNDTFSICDRLSSNVTRSEDELPATADGRRAVRRWRSGDAEYETAVRKHVQIIEEEDRRQLVVLGDRRRHGLTIVRDDPR